MQKKAISPVVATALLLVVAVVAVVGFQSWFTTYQSGVNVKVEKQSNAGSAITVERLETDGTAYIKNGGTEDITVLNTSKILDSTGAVVANCTSTDNLDVNTATAGQVTAIDFGACTPTSGSQYDVVVITSTGVYSSTQLAR